LPLGITIAYCNLFNEKYSRISTMARMAKASSVKVVRLMTSSRLPEPLARQRVRRAPVAQPQNMRRCSCGPTKAYPRLALRSAATWTFVMAGVRTGALTAPRPIKPTSPRCHSAWQPNPGRGSTCRRGKSVQTTRTTCIDRSWPRCCPNS
jgi:hypothetical protein